MEFAKQTKTKSCPNIISKGTKVKAKADDCMGWSGQRTSTAFLASDRRKVVSYRQRGKGDTWGNITQIRVKPATVLVTSPSYPAHGWPSTELSTDPLSSLHDFSLHFAEERMSLERLCVPCEATQLLGVRA